MILLEIKKELFANATFAASTYQISRTIIRQFSHPVDADKPTAILRVGDREHRYHASLERSVRRSSIDEILLPNHFRRLILQFEFARACARNHPISLPAHIPAIKRKWALDRPISPRFPLSSSCCDISLRRPISLSLPHHARIYALFSVSGSTHKQARSSLEKCMGWVHNSVDKNNQV